ncbi:MAG: lipoyl(octanoyl) transferase LipB [Phycisphaerae bacterium]|nr:lipoyl(octanoyl) transferase LipB [Phycisphaerae bacterium]
MNTALANLPEGHQAAIATLDVGIMDYRSAWDLQLTLHKRVLSGEFSAGILMLVEHPPTITIGRHPDARRHLLASPAMLNARHVEVLETDRGGDITFHGPGQLVVYPIIPLNSYNLKLHNYMRLLEQVIIEVLARFGVTGQRSLGATGVWVAGAGTSAPAKICAMGIKLRRWVSLHGLALNITTDLSFFDLINPCGLGRPVTSLAVLLGQRAPTMAQVKMAVVEQFRTALPNYLPLHKESSPSS